MIEVVLFLVAAYLIYLFITRVLPVLLAGGGILILTVIGIAFLAGALIGLAVAVRNYARAITEHVDFSEWEWKKDSEPAVRSYFFGPGYQQLRETIADAFKRNRAEQKKHKNAFLPFRIALFICVNLFGTVIMIIFAAIHGTVTTLVMMITYVVFTVVWALDRVYLQIRRIRSVCPVCKKRSLIPYFVCPQCGEIHKKLVPGPYGILNHTCVCGYSLPATFFNGRSQLDSKCPCGAMLVASDAVQIGIQLIGGSKSGKSVLLAALFHEYLERLKRVKSLHMEITDEYRPYFDELEDWYKGGEAPPTEYMNSRMYPILLKKKKGIKKQLSVYDIAGEMFDGVTARNEVLQEQFHYCSGLMFLIDPFSDGNLRSGRIRAGGTLGEFSNMKPDEVATNFINYLVSTGHARTSERLAVPMAVMIVKSDITEVRRVIGPARLNAMVKRGEYTGYEQARDAECRKFLVDIGLDLAVSTLEAKFSNLHYFPVSAMGHSPDGDPYEPWGIMEAMDWIMAQADSELNSMIRTVNVQRA